MKLEVGMYVRFKNGTINKITKFELPTIYKKFNTLCFERTMVEELFTDEELEELKASNNIIDLIEVGDYVNGYKVSAIYNPNGDEIINFTLIMEYGYETINVYNDNYLIKSIVTKEHFESIQYKVD